MISEEQKRVATQLLETLTLGDTVQAEVMLPRIYINTFPKSGTHLANLICAHLAQMQEPKHWLGSFSGNSWTNNWVDDEILLRVINAQPAGTWYQGHMGHKPEIAEAFDKMNVCMFFIYRDLRDVAVSQTYHIENPDDDKCRHPNKNLYQDMPTHEDRLMAVINGIEGFPGIIERWELYAPWLYLPWVLPIRYEDMRQRPEWVAEKAVGYIIERTTKDFSGQALMFSQNIINAINKSIELMGTTEHSASFRKGSVGDWRTEFTPEIKKAFKDTEIKSGTYWLEKLGYQNEEW